MRKSVLMTAMVSAAALAAACATQAGGNADTESVQTPSAQTETQPTEGAGSPSTDSSMSASNGPDASGSATASGGPGVLETAEKSGQFSKLLSAIELAGLEETLAGSGPYTILAPTDAAFEAMSPGLLDQLMQPEYRPQLRTVLLYHVIPGRQTAAQLSAQQSPTIEASNGLTLKVEKPAAGQVTINGANVVQADLMASNGVIHVIDTVLVPTAGSSAGAR